MREPFSQVLMKLTPFVAALSLVAAVACATERTVAPVVASGAVAPSRIKVPAFQADTSQAPLWILDGKIIDPPADGSIDKTKIESVEVIKGKAAMDKYGPRALNGVVIVKTKA